MFLEADNNPKGIQRQYKFNFTISLKLVEIRSKNFGYNLSNFHNMAVCCSNATQFPSVCCFYA